MKQSIGLTFLFAALNGIGNTLAALVLVVENDRIEQRGMPSTKARNIAALILNLMLQGITTVFGMMSPWFGPASLYFPTSLCSQLLSNMICFGFILKREDLNKDTQVATYNILISVLLLPVVGPGAQDGSSVQFPPDPRENPLSAAWLILHLAVFAISLTVIVVKDLKTMKNLTAEMWLITYAVAGGTLYPTLSRAFSISSGGARVGFLVGYLVVAISWCFQAIVEAKCVTSRTKYIPTKMCTMLFFNAISGIIVWEDWRVMMSWLGYICTFMLMVLGVYLMSTLEFFIVVHKEQTKARIAGHARRASIFQVEAMRPGRGRRSSLPIFARQFSHRPTPRKSQSETPRSKNRPSLVPQQNAEDDDYNLDDWYLKVFSNVKKQTERFSVMIGSRRQVMDEGNVADNCLKALEELQEEDEDEESTDNSSNPVAQEVLMEEAGEKPKTSSDRATQMHSEQSAANVFKDQFSQRGSVSFSY